MAHREDSVEVVRVVKVLRTNCDGIVFRRVIDSEGRLFLFTPIPAARYAPIGETSEYHSQPWIVSPGMSFGTGVMQQIANRWCPSWNFLQRWVWPMREVNEAKFTVIAESP